VFDSHALPPTSHPRYQRSIPSAVATAVHRKDDPTLNQSMQALTVTNLQDRM
jgi:hypothetical protein